MVHQKKAQHRTQHVGAKDVQRTKRGSVTKKLFGVTQFSHL